MAAARVRANADRAEVAADGAAAVGAGTDAASPTAEEGAVAASNAIDDAADADGEEDC
jgi:hypothetical protein